ncbi:hypothetical protein [Hyphomicrobium methylovorum]|uniref:hypothetical protein n=1 Tax=Hyphomicrobium methylovorum TaxID=84 RepID=UPI0015E7B3C4|nr:hypothetical protein [Hyphomicrobium methylovorum]
MDDLDTLRDTSSFTPINIRFDLYGSVEKTLAAHGVSIKDFVLRAFIEVSNCGNGFEVAHQAFELRGNGQSLWFNVTSYPRLDDAEVCLCISPGKGPNNREPADKFFEELSCNLFDESATSTKH